MSAPIPTIEDLYAGHELVECPNCGNPFPKDAKDDHRFGKVCKPCREKIGKELADSRKTEREKRREREQRRRERRERRRNFERMVF